LAEKIGRTMTPELFSESFGMRNEQIIPELFLWAEPGDSVAIKKLGDEKEALYRELIRRDGLQALDGVETLLRRLKEHSIPCSVGTSTPYKNIEASMELIGLSDFFQGVAASEDVSKGKPDPEVFLIAAEKINRQPENCVVFEDAHAGIQAGNSAGMLTIAVTTTHAADTFERLADRVVDNLNEVSIEQIFESLQKNH
jgi:HAD superfamily hydrolase (TIGR01509 family)